MTELKHFLAASKKSAFYSVCMRRTNAKLISKQNAANMLFKCLKHKATVSQKRLKTDPRLK